MKHWILILTILGSAPVMVSIDFNDSKSCEKAAIRWLESMETKGISHKRLSALCVKSYSKRF